MGESVGILGDLPRGEPADIAYVRGKRLVVSGQVVLLEQPAISAVGTDRSVVLSTRTGTILRVHARSLRTETLAKNAAGPPVVDPHGNFVAWQVDSSGRAEVVLRFLGRWGTQFLDRQRFPAGPSCCDSPFQVEGMTGSALYASAPAAGRAWVWSVYEGQEGIPNDLPDSGAHVSRVRGMTGGLIHEVGTDELVVEYPATSEGSAAVVGYGPVRDGAYSEVERLRAVSLDVDDPRDRRIVYWTDDGQGHVAWRSGRQLAIQLPTTFAVLDVTWEGNDRFLVEVLDPELGQRALVRCDARTGECELADRIRGRALIAFG